MILDIHVLACTLTFADRHYKIENGIRPLALGRKNYLFAGSQKGAQRAAMIYSFLASWNTLGINPWEWLRYAPADTQSKHQPYKRIIARQLLN